MSLILSFLAPPLIGFLLISLLWPSQGPLRSQLVIKSFLALGLGLGISSCIFFLWSVAFYPSSAGFATVEATLLIGLAVIFSYVMRTRGGSANPPLGPIANPRTHWILPACFYTSLLAAAIAFILSFIRNPHGGWDAWAIWNMRARFIFRGGDHWTDALSGLLSWSHPDYPLLVPALVARGWVYAGQETVVVPALVSMLFALATVGLLSSSVTVLRGKTQGLLAGITLLGTPLFIEQGTSQLADIPLSFFFLATIALFCFQEELAKNKPGFLFLAGMAAGLSAWAKNEGLLFLGSIMLARLAVRVWVREWKVYLRQMTVFALGLAPVLTILLYYKTQLVPPNDLLSALGSEASLARLADLSRYWVVGKAFAVEAAHFGKGFFSGTLLLLVYLLLLGRNDEEKAAREIVAALMTLGMLLVGYFFAYIIIPYELLWSLSTSLSRLFLQLWPSLLLVFFLAVNTPEQAMRLHPSPDQRSRA